MPLSVLGQQSPGWGWYASIATVLRYRGVLVDDSEVWRSMREATVREGAGDLRPDEFLPKQFSLPPGDERAASTTIILHRKPIESTKKLVDLVDKDVPLILTAFHHAYVLLRVTYDKDSMSLKEVRVFDPSSSSPGSLKDLSNLELMQAELVLVDLPAP